jgi:hypothetical protein
MHGYFLQKRTKKDEKLNVIWHEFFLNNAFIFGLTKGFLP